jgi:hypothetical protein
MKHTGGHENDFTTRDFSCPATAKVSRRMAARFGSLPGPKTVRQDL